VFRPRCGQAWWSAAARTSSGVIDSLDPYRPDGLPTVDETGCVRCPPTSAPLSNRPGLVAVRLDDEDSKVELARMRMESGMELGQTSGTELALAWSSVFAAVGTVGAFVVGGWVLFRQVKRDRALDAERERSRRRRQAEQVAAWVGSFDADSDKLQSSFDPDSDKLQSESMEQHYPRLGTTPAAIVRNSSRLPIWDVSLNWATREGPILDNTMTFATIPPDDEVAWEAPDWLPELERPTIGIQISFRDASMVWWRRDQYGILTDLGSPSPPAAPRESLCLYTAAQSGPQR